MTPNGTLCQRHWTCRCQLADVDVLGKPGASHVVFADYSRILVLGPLPWPERWFGFTMRHMDSDPLLPQAGDVGPHANINKSQSRANYKESEDAVRHSQVSVISDNCE